MGDLNHLFQQFLRERRYLQNITPKTVAWYEAAWLAFTRSCPSGVPAQLTRPALQEFIIQLRDRGVRPVTCNTWIRALNVFCGWLHEQGHCLERVKLKTLRVEKRIIVTLDEARIRALLTYKARTFDQHRVHTLVCALLDTGCRVDEMLSARVIDFDFDNLLLLVMGKGRKERRIPFSADLRKRLYRYQKASEAAGIRSPLMFPERQGGKWHQRNALRSYYCLQRKLGGPKNGFHRLRHTFATQYLKHGGDVVRLSLVLGHSEVGTSMRYLHLLTEDLQRPHEALSILNRLG